MAKPVRTSLQPDYAVNILACLDRFSLDSAGFASPTLNEIISKHLPEEPLRLLDSVTIVWHANVITASVVPNSPLGKTMSIEREKREKGLRKVAALCGNSFVKLFRLDECGDWIRRSFLDAFSECLPGIRIERLMVVDYVDADEYGGVKHVIQQARGVDTLLLKTQCEWDVSNETLEWCKELGVRRVAVAGAQNIDEDGVRAFCVHPSTAAAGPQRALYLDGTSLSFEFLQELAQECLTADGSRMTPLITYPSEDFNPTLPEHLAKKHHKNGRRCLHFRFDAAAGPYEIIALNQFGQQWKVMLRGGHSAMKHCKGIFRRENWFRELEEETGKPSEDCVVLCAL